MNLRPRPRHHHRLFLLNLSLLKFYFVQPSQHQAVVRPDIFSACSFVHTLPESCCIHIPLDLHRCACDRNPHSWDKVCWAVLYICVHNASCMFLYNVERSHRLMRSFSRLKSDWKGDYKVWNIVVKTGCLDATFSTMILKYLRSSHQFYGMVIQDPIPNGRVCRFQWAK